MPDDERDVRGPHQEPEPGEARPPLQGKDIPASVMFSEMMRQAAARSKPRPSVWADPAVPGLPSNRTYNTRARLSGDDRPRPVNPPPMFEDEPASPPPEDDAGDGDGGDGGNHEPPPPPPSQEYEDALEAQRVRRVKRRKTRARRRTVGMFGGLFRSLFVVVAAAGLMATIFTWYTPSGLISSDVRQGLSVAIATSSVSSAPQPTAMPTPNWLRRIGIVSGHRGPENDPGAVCPDGLTEAEINFNVAQLVVRNLRGRGYTVDLLDEFDPRLDGYQAAALVSIHANTCQEWPGEIVSGYLIAAAAARVTARGNDQVLVDCVGRHYGVASGLQRRDGVTVDMTDYHTFREIHPLTPASILELGFMLADREVLTNQPDALARGITDGILCFMEPGALPTPEPAPTAEAAV